MDEHRYKDFWSFIKLLSDNDLLSHVIIIGSWAEYIYTQAGVLSGFEASLRTLDMDFLVRNMRRPTKPVSIPVLAREAGYFVDSDYLVGSTKIYTPDLMEVEFLIAQQGSGVSNILKTNLGVNAQALRHMTMIRDNTLTVNLFDMNITIPEPEAYVLHKMIINNQRGKKAEKDRTAIHTLFPFLNLSRYNTLYQALTIKEKKLVDEYRSVYGLLME